MNFRVMLWLIFFFFGTGLALVLFSLYGFLRELARWTGRPRGILSRASAMTARMEKRRKPGTYLEFEFPWVTAYLITVPALVLLWFALEGMSVQYMSLVVLLFPVLARRWILRQKKHEAANEIRQFLIELRLQLSS
jgi:hypothetical protein